MAVLESPSDPRLDTLDGRPVRYWGAYIPKLHEYRVHCAWGVGVFHIQHKRRLKGFNERNNQIRNHKNGWIYAVNEILYPEGDVLANAWRAFSATGLHFGAVDVIYNQGSNKSWVLEINTAPGLFGSTLEKYVEVLPRVMESIDKGNYF